MTILIRIALMAISVATITPVARGATLTGAPGIAASTPIGHMG
jgi:hypothetical protein